MKTLWEEAARQELITRLKRLTPESKPQWGKMNCEQMLAHVADALRMATGELPVEPKGGPFSLPVVKQLIMFYLPWPKGAPTAPELLARPAGRLDEEVTALLKLMAEFPQQQGKQQWPAHPAFGPLSGQEWGALMHRHIDHHLRQFGV